MTAEAQPRELDARLRALEELLRGLAPIAIGFSGGVDSTFLALVAARAVPGRAVLVHVATPFATTPELEALAAFGRLDLPAPRLIEAPFDPFADAGVAANGPDRCYRCKLAIFTRVRDIARGHGMAAVADGSNADDAGEDRPGMRALRELGVRSPLLETGWRKADERALLRAWWVPTWSLPAGACLATRIETATPLSADAIAAVRACEDLLHAMGLSQVRARIRPDGMHIEASPGDLERIANAAGAARLEPVRLSAELKERLEGLAGMRVSSRVLPYRPGSAGLPPRAQR